MADQTTTDEFVVVKGVKWATDSRNPEGIVRLPKGLSEQQIIDSISRQGALIQEQANQKRYAANKQTYEAPSTLERIGRGATDVLDRISQLWIAGGEKLGAYPEGLGDAMTKGANEEIALYDKHRLGANPKDVDVGRVGGNVLMQAPLALVPGGQSYAGAALSGAGTGAASGLLTYDPSNTFSQGASNTLIGAGTGAVAGPLARAFTEGGKVLTQKTLGKFKGYMERMGGKADPTEILREVPEFSSLPVDVRATLIKEAQDQIAATGTFNTEQLSRKANLIANDVTPTKSMVTRDPRDWSMERNMQKLSQSPDEQISGMGRELTDVYRGNDAALAARLESFSKGMPKATQEGHGQAIMESLDRLSVASQKEVSALYNQVRDTAGDQLASDAKSLYSTLDNLKDSTYAEKMVGSVMNKLKRFGMVDKDGNLTANSLTVTQAEELRKFVNTLPNDYGKRDIIKAIDADVLHGAGADAFGMARKAAQGRFEMLGNAATQKALNAYGELTQGRTAQNFIKTQIIDGSAQDVDSLLKTLSKLPAEEAQDATLRIRAGVLDYLQSKAVNENSNKFSGAALTKAMGQIGDDKLKMILGETGHKELKSLARAGVDATYEPAYAAVNHSNTAPTLASWMMRGKAVTGVNLPLGLNDAAIRLAEKRGYGQQLGQILGAQSQQALPQVPERVQSLVRLIQQSGAPSAAAAVNDQRNNQGR